MKRFLKEMFSQALSPPTLFSSITAIVLLTIAGPFGTFDGLSLLERAQYWGLVISTAILSVYAVKVFVEERLAALVHWQQAFAISFIFTAVYTPLLALLAFGLTGDKREVTPVWLMYVIVFGVSMAIIQLRYFLVREMAQNTVPILRRFADPSARILHMTVRDHYVDVFTDKGTEKLLMRFSDALSELQGLDGLQVHRSHWVATEAVRGVERQNGRLFVVLTGEQRIPVSRAYRDDVERKFG